MIVTTRKFTTKATPEKTQKPRKRANDDNPLTLSDYHKQALIGLTLGDVSALLYTPAPGPSLGPG